MKLNDLVGKETDEIITKLHTAQEQNTVQLLYSSFYESMITASLKVVEHKKRSLSLFFVTEKRSSFIVNKRADC